MLATLILSLTLSTPLAPGLRMQTPDWAFTTAIEPGTPTPAAVVDALLAEADAELATVASRYDSPFALDEYVPPFVDMATPAEDAREAVAVFSLNAVLDQLDGLARP